MIRTDESGEEFVFENDWDTAIPIIIRENERSELNIEVFPSYLEQARKFEAEFADDPFSDSAMKYIFDEIGAKMRMRGYDDDKKHRAIWNRCYVIKSISDINKEVVLPSTYKLSRETSKGKRNKTTFNLKLYIREGITSYITVHKSEIVSIAAENNIPSSDFENESDLIPVTEIGVETALSYRKKGYAASNAAALASEIIERTGGYVTYETQYTNEASAKTAERVGFKQYGRCFYYVMRK